MLSAGTRLGTYEITAPIGAGGMGEVYKAKDVRLDRTVAIKVLPEHLSKDPALRERFEREARAVSSLNHPHICTLHDVGEHDGIHFLVMEYLEGETLSDRLKKGALPLELALEYSAQIADALDKAHCEGVVHRDLKPGNLMLTKPGVKLLDFGLAKASPPRRSLGEGGPDAPTQQKPLTDAGTILGTVQYMAPEQLEGNDVDACADLFALGAVLFEMVTGRKAFEGQSQASLISAIMSTDPPPVSELQSLSPPALDRIVRSCLTKDPAERWHSAHDLKTELDWLRSASSTQNETRSDTRPWRWATAAMALLLAAAVATIISNGSPSPSVEPLHLNVDLGPTDTLAVGHGRPGVTISPDGSRLAYVATRDDGPTQLFVRSLDEYEATPLAGTEGAQYPFFSPDGEWIAFLSGLAIQRISVSGGAPVRVAAYGGFSFTGGDWLPDGDMVLGAWNKPLRRISSTDGSIEELTVLHDGVLGHAWPDVLPGGKAILFTVFAGGGSGNASIEVESLETGERRTLLKSIYARYVPSGHLLYLRDQNLMAAPFDLHRLALTGPAIPVVANIRVTPAWSADFGVSDRGELVYVTGSSAMLARQLVLADEPRSRVDGYASVRASPGGDRLALQLLGRLGRLSEGWVYDIPRDTMTRLAAGSDAHRVSWTPDGRRIVYTTNQNGSHNLFWVAADGSGEAERLTTSPHHQLPGSVSPDGKLLAFAEGTESEAGWDIRLLPLDESQESRPFLATSDNEHSPMFSPDGNWIAYVSDELGQNAVYIQPFPGPGPKTRIDDAGGNEPVWSRDGRELHYLARNGTLTSVELHYDQGLRAGAARIRTSGGIVSPNIEETAYDVMPDGSFVVIRDDPSNRDDAEIRFVANWFEELKRLAPPEN